MKWMLGVSWRNINSFTTSHHVFHSNSTGSPAQDPLRHLHKSLQSNEVMATRFLQDRQEASIQTGTEIQAEGEAKVGKTEVDEVCEDCADELDCLYVQIRAWRRGEERC